MSQASSHQTQQDKTSSASASSKQKRAMNHQEQLKEKARSIAHFLRASSKSTLEQRSARLRDDRVSFFRAKDFYRSLRADPEFVEKECTIGGKSMDDKIEYLGNVLLHCGLIQRCERIYKDPRKGRTKRVKYPHYLEKTKNQSFSYPTNDDDSFYAWTYDQPMSWTFLIASWAVAILVMLACLFPLAPIWFKKIILYLCVAILMFFTVILVVRGVVFACVWLVSGRHFWILPNIASDEIPINEVFSPMWMFDDLDASGNVVGKIGIVQRILGTGILSGVLVGVYKIAPEKTQALKIVGRAHDAILEQFHLKKGFLEGSNETSANATSTSGGLEGGLSNITASLLVNATNNTINSSADASVPFCELFPEDDECADYVPKKKEKAEEEKTTTTTSTGEKAHSEL
jgi:translocation protein SEC62